MKIINRVIITIIFMISSLYSVGEAGAIFLLINPGSGAAGVGEAQVAKADDAYASYYNPAGLAFLEDKQVVLQHVNWLPNLADDIFYEFIAYSHHVPNIGTFGGHLIFLNLGEQTATDEFGLELGKFKSYMTAFTGSYGMKLNSTAAFGVNFKVYHQKLSESFYDEKSGVGSEVGDPFSTDFAFDIGYLKKFGKEQQHRFGISVQNIGPPIDFVDSEQSDPAPTNMRLGLYTRIFKTEKNSLHFLFDANKLLVASYPEMDWNGDGIISGSKEQVHTDTWTKALLTSWLDDWHYGGDLNVCNGDCNTEWPDEIGYSGDLDDRIGGYTPASFTWYQTHNPSGTPSEYIKEIYVPNYEDFCILDRADCYTADHELITESNYDVETISYIDLPHDNLGLAPVYEFENPVYLSAPETDPNDPNIIYDAGCWTADPENGGAYISSFNCGIYADTNTSYWDLDPNGKGVDNYDQQYFSSEDIQAAITSGELIMTQGCNAFSSNGVMWTGALNSNESEIGGNSNDKPCNADLEYMDVNEYSFSDDEYGVYNVYGNKEKGTGDERKFADELKEMIYNFGFEMWYTDHFALRIGYIYDEEGKIKNPTFGAGIKFNKYGFDFGYTSGDKGHPRANTMFYSLSLGI